MASPGVCIWKNAIHVYKIVEAANPAFDTIMSRDELLEVVGVIVGARTREQELVLLEAG